MNTARGSSVVSTSCGCQQRGIRPQQMSRMFACHPLQSRASSAPVAGPSSRCAAAAAPSCWQQQPSAPWMCRSCSCPAAAAPRGGMLTRTPAAGPRNNLLRTASAASSSSASTSPLLLTRTRNLPLLRQIQIRALDPQKPPPAKQPAVQWGRHKPQLSPRPGSGAETSEADAAKQGKLGPVQESETDATWGLLEPGRLEYKWPVPWGAWTLVGGMVLWLLSFIGTGFLLVPAIYKQAGIDIYSLSSQDKAVFTCVCQLAETVVTLALIRLLTVKSMTAGPAEAREVLFNYSPSQPFARPRGWAVWATLGTALSPAVVGTVAGLLSLTGYEEAVGGRGTVDGVASMITIDLPTYLSLLSVTGILAPILEETVFRGFLLTSLTQFMPTWAAIPSSAFIFGLAHLSPKDFPVLFSLGCLLGVLYTRSRNLLTPIIVHGAWNSAVLTLLFALAAFGINIQELIGAVDDLPAS